MENPIQVLKSSIATLPKSQKLVADYIINHYTEVGFMTVEQLSKKVGTSTTSIMRLMSNVGYSGYSEFQKKLHVVLKEKATPQMRLEENLKNHRHGEAWMRHYNLQMDQIQQAIDQNLESSLTDAIHLIKASQHIYCTSVRSGLPVAQYLTHNLNRMLGHTRMTLADSSDWVDDVIGMTENDLIIAVSYARYGKRLIQYVDQAKQKGAKVLAITDNYSSPIIPYADVVLTCSANSIASHNSLVSTIFIVDYLIGTLSMEQSDSVSERLKEVGEILKDIDYHNGM